MPGCIRLALSLCALLLFGLPVALGQPNWHDRPTIYVPQKPPTKQDLDRRESLKQYVLGLLYVREDRLLDAVKALEKAVELDPQATPVYKMLIPFYVALDRAPAALKATKKVLEQDPDDFETWFVYARQLKNSGQFKEARAALERGLKVPGLKARPELAEPMHLLLGVLYENAQEWQKAAAAFGNAVKILDHPEAILDADPVATKEAIAARAAELLEHIGGLHLKTERYDDAVASYQQAQKRYPDGAGRLNFNLAQVSHKQGRLPQAVIYLDAYLRLQPQGLEAYELKIKILQSLRRDAEILPWLEQASRADAFNVGLKLLLAKSYVQGRQGNKAEKVYQELAAKSPSGEVYRGLFRLYKDERRLGQALDLINRTFQEAKEEKVGPNPAAPQADAIIAALRDDRDLAKDLVDVGYKQINLDRNLKFQTVHLLAVLADRQRQTKEAEAFYRRCLTNYTPQSEALVYSGLLRVLWKARKYDEVIQVCRQGLRVTKSTNHSLFFSELALALARKGQYDAALKESERGLDLGGDDDRKMFRRLRIRILTMAERYDKAEADCKAMLKDFPQAGDTLETRYLLSGVYSAARKFAQSEEQLELILKLDPDNATANNDLGYIWADQGKKLKEAEELIRKAIDLDGRQRKRLTDGGEENAAYVDSLGWVLFRRGQIDAARAELEKAVKLQDGDDPTIWDHLGDVYYRQGEMERARTTWQRAKDLYERENSRTMDHRYKELQRKIKLLDSVSK
jgi:tetratricopeptide (TPR) repeat protein